MARFLVVDDDPAAVAAVASLLTKDGHDVVPFTAGEHAVGALAREPFDAVMTDLEMPIVDGYAVVRATRERHPRACVVVVTGRAEEELRELIKAGACIVSDKPLRFDEVTKAVDDCRHRGGPALHGSCYLRSLPDDQQLFSLRRR